MSDTNTQEARDRAALNNAIQTPQVIRAVEGALCDIWSEKRGQSSIEESALAYQYYGGACELVAKLYAKASEKPHMTIAPKRIRHRAS